MKNGRTDQSEADDQHIFSKAITLIDIGFDNLEVKLTKESIADRASSLVSDLGGQLGLWLGISMVSLLEVLSCIFYSGFIVECRKPPIFTWWKSQIFECTALHPTLGGQGQTQALEKVARF